MDFIVLFRNEKVWISVMGMEKRDFVLEIEVILIVFGDELSVGKLDEWEI